MPRRREIPKRDIAPDPLYDSALVSKFINCVMSDGKRSTAERILYRSFDIIKEKTGDDPVRADVVQHDIVAGKRADMGDTRAHLAGPDDADSPDINHKDKASNAPAVTPCADVTAF